MSVGAGPSSEPGNVCNAKRQELSKQLHNLKRPEIAGLYDRAIRALAEPSGSVDRVMTVGHCIRELANNLAEALGDVDALPPWSDMSKPTVELARVWALRMGPAADFVSTTSSEGEAQTAPSLVSVHAEVVEAAHAVVQATETGSGNAHKRHSAVVLGYIESRQDASVAIYRKAVDYFTGIAHLNKLNPEALPSTEEMVKHLETIETVIRARLFNFFDVVHDLVSLQTAANRKHVSSARSPG